MTDQTPSGNRWEPADPTTTPEGPAAPPAGDATPAGPPPPPQAPPPAPVVPERPARWRALLRRPGRPAWLAAGLSALVVLTGLGGFLAGRASVDVGPAPTEVGQQWHRGPGEGELPDRPFGGPDGDPDGDWDGDGNGDGPGLAPGTES